MIGIESEVTSSVSGMTKEEEDAEDSVRRALKDGPFAMRQLAAESGLSYDVLRSWRSGRRRPNPESIRKLVSGLNRRADRLKGLAGELRKML
jgi:transcriptional regulator with XRE-family HTH domain